MEANDTPAAREAAAPRPSFPIRLLALAGRCVHPFERAARRLLGPNGDLKVFAVAAAAVLYGLVHPVAEGFDRTFSVPVEVVSLNPLSTVVAVVPDHVGVVLRGTEKAFAAVNPDSLRFALEATPGSNELSGVVALPPKGLQNRNGVRLVSTDTDVVSVRYDFMSYIVTTNLVAVPALRGTAGGEATVEMPPDVAVRILGPVSRLNAFSAKPVPLQTDPIDVEGKTQSFDARVAIRPPADAGITSVEPSEIKVRVEIVVPDDAAADATVSAPVLLTPADIAPAPPAAPEKGPEAVPSEAPAAAAVPTAEPAPAAPLVDEEEGEGRGEAPAPEAAAAAEPAQP